MKLRIYRSDQTPVKTIETSTVIGPGAAELPFTWDGSQDPPLEGTPEPGVYLFTWQVGGPGPTMDADQDKSAQLHVTETHTEIVSYDEQTDLVGVLAKCVFVDDVGPVQDAAEARLTTYGPALTVIAGPLSVPPAVNSASASPPIWNPVTINIPLEDEGQYTHLISARDSCWSEDRSHLNRWALQRNHAPVHPRADNYAQIPDEPGMDRTARFWQKLAGYAARANGAATAPTILDRLPGDRLFFFSGHGSQGGGQVSASDAAICAKGSPHTPPYNLSGCDLRNVRLAVWLACYTAAWDDDFGGIAEMTHRKGATCSVGWPETVSYAKNDPGGTSRAWVNRLYQALASGTGLGRPPASVAEALAYADETPNCSSYALDRHVEFGDSGVRIVPR